LEVIMPGPISIKKRPMVLHRERLGLMVPFVSSAMRGLVTKPLSSG